MNNILKIATESAKMSKNRTALGTRLRSRIFSSLIFLFGITLNHSSAAKTGDLQLPALGENSAGLISITEEYNRGQMVLRYYRAVLPLSHDPFIETYLDSLLQRIVTYSELQNKRLELLVLENPTLNAFAAPGGIVGVHTGIFLIAENEHQLASILAHELAHLSQRHYARRVQQGKKNMAVTMAALVASIILGATGEGDAVMAGILLSQAAIRDAGLKFSRDMEKEADRVGMQTLLKGDFNPHAMPDMFEQMLKSTRYRTKVPDFLLSHPVTESRIADSENRVRNYPIRYYPPNEDYQLIRARVMMHYETNAAHAVKRFSDAIKNPQKMSPLTAHYGLVLALTQAKEIDKARSALKQFKKISHHADAAIIAEADIAAADDDFTLALKLLNNGLRYSPSSHPLNIRYAELLMESGEYEKCEEVLSKHVKRHPNNDYIWYLLAEVHGLAGHILDVHKARAEYFILKGVYGKAEIQLQNARKLMDKDDFQGRAKIEQRLLDLRRLMREAEEGI